MKLRRIKLIAMVLANLVALGAAVWVGAGTTGIISGVVKSADDGKPISGANIIVTGTKLTTVTDAKGYYVITNIPPGDYEIRAEMVGYAKIASDRVQVTMDSTATVNFDMKQEAIVETAASVARPRSMVSPDVTSTLNLLTATQADFTRTDPSSINTVGGALSSMPGVIVEPDGTGQMHLRGGRYDQVGYYIEGIPIVDPNWGMFSDNNFTTGISKFQVYPGGFGAEYGNAIAGVLNEVKKTGESMSGFRLRTDGGNNDFRNAYAEFGGGAPNAFNYYLGSTAQVNEMSGSPILLKQAYSDSVAKMVWPWKNDTLTVLGLSGNLDGQTGYSDHMRQTYNIAAATLSHNFSPKSFLTIRPYYIFCSSLQSMVNTSGRYMNTWSAQHGLMVGYTGQLNEKHLLKTGGMLLQSDNNQWAFSNTPWYKADVNTLQTALYAEDQMKLKDNLTFNAGLRYEAITYDRKGDQLVPGAGYTGDPVPDITRHVLDPRLGLSYAADSRTVWRASWGMYSKWIPASTVQCIYYGATLAAIDAREASLHGLGATDPQRSTAAEISFERQISDSMALRITPYLADYTNLGDYVDAGDGIYQYLNAGRGKSRGVEFNLRRKMADNWQGWLSYTYQSIKAGTDGTPMTYTSWDQRHTASLVTEYKAGKAAHNLRVDLGSGRADYGDPTEQSWANPYAVVTYGLKLDLPKSSPLGESLYFDVYNLFNNRQTTQYWVGGGRGTYSTMPERIISLGVNRSF